MKNKALVIILPLLFWPILAYGSADQHKSLASIYRTGGIRFIPEMTLDGNSLPKDVMFVGPVDVALDAAGNIYVLDFSDSNIKIFGPSGKFEKVVGSKGQGPGEFRMPVSLAAVKDRLLVWDMGNRRLCALTLEGAFIKSVDMSSFSARPARKLRALPSGDLVMETEKTYFEDPSKPQDCILEIVSPELKSLGAIYTQPVWRNKYIRIEQSLTNLPLPFAPDLHWDVSPDGNIVIGYSEKYEFGVYNAEGGNLLTIIRPYDAVKVTEDDKKEIFNNMTHTTNVGIQRGAPDYVVKNTVFPKVKHAYDDLLVDWEGNIWVHPRQKVKDDEKRFFDAFDGKGKFLGRVEIAGEPSYPYQAKILGGFLWNIETDQEGFFKVVKYRIAEAAAAPRAKSDAL